MSALLPKVGAAVALPAAASDALARPAMVVRRPMQTHLLSAARARTAIIAVGERGVILRSEDEARTWTQVAAPTSVTLTAVAFDGDRGVAVGHGGVILLSTDAGASWVQVFNGEQLAQQLQDEASRRADPVDMAAAERLVVEGPDKPFLALQKLASGRWLVLGAYGLAAKSDDAGRTWGTLEYPIDNPKGLHVYAIRALADRVIAVGEQGLVLMSDDAGQRFKAMSTPYRGTFFAAELAKDGRIWLAGLRGTVLASSDHGATWQSYATPGPVSITDSVLRGDAPLLATQSGQILALDGNRFVPLPVAALAPMNALLPLEQSGILALTVAGPVRLTSVVLPAAVGTQ